MGTGNVIDYEPHHLACPTFASDSGMTRPTLPSAVPWNHSPALTRRSAITAGALSLCGLGMNHLAGLRQAQAATALAIVASAARRLASLSFFQADWPAR